VTAVVPVPADEPDELDHRHHPGTRRGRPRNPGTGTAILDATLELIAETGLTGTSVESVAARAGVGKATIYRRWPSKEVLVGEALARLAEDVPQIVTGATVRESLVAIVEQIRCKSPETLSGRIMPRMMSHASRSPELFRLYYDQVMRPRRARVAAVLVAGVASGELRPDLDIELAVTLVTAPMLYLNLVQAGCGRAEAGTSRALVQALLDGIGNDAVRAQPSGPATPLSPGGRARATGSSPAGDGPGRTP
jgi:AcrR family transcriptional regulator